MRIRYTAIALADLSELARYALEHLEEELCRCWGRRSAKRLRCA